MSNRTHARPLRVSKLPRNRYQWKMVFHKGPNFKMTSAITQNGPARIGLHVRQPNANELMTFIDQSMQGHRRSRVIHCLTEQFEPCQAVDHILLELESDVMLIKLAHAGSIRQIYKFVVNPEAYSESDSAGLGESECSSTRSK